LKVYLVVSSLFGDAIDSNSDKSSYDVLTSLSDAAELIGNRVTDLGAELYPPLDADAVNLQFSYLVESLKSFISSLDENQIKVFIESNAECKSAFSNCMDSLLHDTEWLISS
jgi:hypothetical protein